ncbi:phospholipase D-like domain-containing protein [Chondromyces apiculatus]|nr:phospholipase D-like domain-containing protein [Chondromyces apiculatus]
MRTETRSKLVLALAALVALSTGGCVAAEDAGGEEGDEVQTDELGISVTSTTLAGHPVWTHFTNPGAYADGHDPTILNEIIRLINDTPQGATIRAAIHSLTANGVQNALISAKNRGVIVKVAEDGSDKHDEDDSPRVLKAALGANLVFCGDGTASGAHGCVTRDASGIMHTKLYTFSQTKDPTGVMRSDVVWFGSANMTNATGANTFNNTVTIYGDEALYDDFNGYFGHLFQQQHYAGNDYYDASASRGYWVTPTVRAYASPEQDSDLVVNRLNDIVADASCRVRVAQAMIHDSRPEIIDLLVKLKKGGCKVWVVGSSIQPTSLAKLKNAGISVRGNNVHDKTVLVYARFAASTENRYLVFTGSHNWTYSANYRNDELFVRLESEDLYDAYYDHFNDAYNNGTAQ